MANTPEKILGNLDFNDIKNSLIDYLKTQAIIKDYNFEGSAIRTLIDLMAYNTFYYAYYMNMVSSEMFIDSAQRIESLISLTKPLGFTVPGRKSARAKIQVSGVTSNEIAKHSTFYGVNSDGIVYTFRNLLSGSMSDSDVVLEVVEGTLVVDSSAQSTINTTSQKYFIQNPNVDLSTIKVFVSENGQDAKEWKLTGNIGSNLTDDNIYFIERLSTGGFAIQFGIENNLGKSIDPDVDEVEVNYMVSSGNAANDISSFSNDTSNTFQFSNLSINVSCPECYKSSGGLNQPNINSIKMLAPKWFSAQGRAVTKSDYTALIYEAGIDFGKFSVFGGEEVYPPKYGRVFVSISNEIEEQKKKDIIALLREYSVITIFPELVQPKTVSYRISIRALTNNPYATLKQKQDISNRIKSYILDNYIEYNRLDTSFYADEISDDIQSTFESDKIELSQDDFVFKLTATGNANQELNISSGNKFKIENSQTVQITDDFIDVLGRNIILYARTNSNTNKANFIKLIAYDANGNLLTGDFGLINIDQGILTIPPISSEEYTVSIELEKKFIKPFANNLNNIFIDEVVVT
jgi:hypothetical protein